MRCGCPERLLRGRNENTTSRSLRPAACRVTRSLADQATFASSKEIAVCSPPCGMTGRQNRSPATRSCFNSTLERSGYRSAMKLSVSSIHASRSSSQASMTPHWRIALNNSSRARSKLLGAFRLRFSLRLRPKTLPLSELHSPRSGGRRIRERVKISAAKPSEKAEHAP